MADPQPDYAGSCMIALYPPSEVAGALAVPSGLSAESMHVTIAYTGDAADVDPEALNAAAKALAARAPFTAAISGHARFTGGTQDCVVALVDGPELETLRADARKALGEQGIGIPSEHGYTPHLTVKYLGEDEPDPVGRLAAFPVTFGAVSAVHGKVRTDYPFAGDLAELAAEAYFSGWALTGAPLTGRVKAGCGAAVRLACEHRGNPGILEAALDLGHLEGIWATVHGRRDRLLARHVKRVMAAWNDCVKPLDARTLVARFRAGAYLASESADPHKQFWRDTATAAALGWLRAIYRSDGYDALVAAIEDAIRSGMAEGEADALALAASQQGKTGFRIAGAFKAAYDRLAGDQGISQQAADTATSIIDGAAGALGRKLASMAGDDGGADDMTSAVTDVTSGSDVRPVRTILGDTIWTAMGAAALSLFSWASQSPGSGTVLVDWLTEPGACKICEENRAGGPYAPQDVPPYLAHRGCRCWLASFSGLPSSLLASFLSGEG